MGVIFNPDGSKTLRAGTRSVTLRSSEFERLETDLQTATRISSAGKIVLDREVSIHIFDRAAKKYAVRLAPIGAIAPDNWWDWPEINLKLTGLR